MSPDEFIIDLFCRVDEIMADQPKHAHAKVHPSEVVTLALLFALKGVAPGFRASRTARGCFGCSIPTICGLKRFWRNRPCLVWLTRSALNCAIHGGRTARIGRLVAKCSPITGGLLVRSWCTS